MEYEYFFFKYQAVLYARIEFYKIISMLYFICYFNQLNNTDPKRVIFITIFMMIKIIVISKICLRYYSSQY